MNEEWVFESVASQVFILALVLSPVAFELRDEARTTQRINKHLGSGATTIITSPDNCKSQGFPLDRFKIRSLNLS